MRWWIFLLLAFLGGAVSTVLEADTRLEVVTDPGEVTRRLLVADGHQVTREQGLWVIEGRSPETLLKSLSLALEALQRQQEAALENARSTRIIAYKRLGPDLRRTFSQGGLVATGNPLNVAIQGDGFFKVRLDDGRIAYTRVGDLRYDLRSQSLQIQGAMLDMRIPIVMTQFEIDSQGLCTAIDINGEGQREAVAQIQLTRFPHPKWLQEVSGGMFLATPEAGVPISGIPGSKLLGVLTQGHLERANVNLVYEELAWRRANEQAQVVIGLMHALDPELVVPEVTPSAPREFELLLEESRKPSLQRCLWGS